MTPAGKRPSPMIFTRIERPCLVRLHLERGILWFPGRDENVLQFDHLPAGLPFRLNAPFPALLQLHPGTLAYRKQGL